MSIPNGDMADAVAVFTKLKNILLERNLKFDTATVSIGSGGGYLPYSVQLTGILYDGSNLRDAQ